MLWQRRNLDLAQRSGDPCRQRLQLTEGLTASSAVGQVPGGEIAGIIERLHDAGGAFIRLGSAALTLAYVAAGRLVGYYEPRLQAWDCFAGLLIVQEAGGLANTFPLETGALSIGPAFAVTATVHLDLLKLIQAPNLSASPEHNGVAIGRI